MQTYAIFRRSGFVSLESLQAAGQRSARTGEQMIDDIRWIRSYVLNESAGRVGTVCIYQATSPQAIRKHAQRAELPADEIVPIADTIVVRPDPTRAT